MSFHTRLFDRHKSKAADYRSTMSTRRGPILHDKAFQPFWAYAHAKPFEITIPNKLISPVNVGRIGSESLDHTLCQLSTSPSHSQLSASEKHR